MIKLNKKDFDGVIIKNPIVASGEHTLFAVIDTELNNVVYEVYSKTYGEETYIHLNVAIDRFNDLEEEEGE